MLQIKNINKKYVTGDLIQNALSDVSLNLRDNEFVAILGPSGSGKTTLLNVIGGLDRYDSGDLIINGISTKKYNDRDWDSYRNHTIGFVFQSYNLIPHQTVLANVELALTISGVSKSERRKRAIDSLEKVGLKEHMNKKPNQLSGGQMQRVAIARALVNDPEILLADEPTGALDTDTSIQVMELLKEVAKEKLVVMVTHNPDLAHEYANRIVKVRDGKIIDDSNEFVVDEKEMKAPEHKNMGKSSMSFLTALVLSFNNLKTKKARTILTSFAGSIGIIGIALIIAISTGVNNYINDIQKDTMTSYPIQISSETMDLSSFFVKKDDSDSSGVKHDLDKVYSDSRQIQMLNTFTSSITENNLTAFKKYLDDKNNDIHKYVGENGIVYEYNTKYNIYTHDKDGVLVNTDGTTLSEMKKQSSNMMSMSSFSSVLGASASNNFVEMASGGEKELVSKSLKKNYDVLYGNWPTNYDEVVVVVNKNNEIDVEVLFELGLLPSSEYKEMYAKALLAEEIKAPEASYTYEELSKLELELIPACDVYKKNIDGTYAYIGDSAADVDKLIKDGSSIKLKVSAIVRAKDDAEGLGINATVGYTRALTDYLIEYTNNSEIVKAQMASPKINIISGLMFEPESDKDKINDTKKYVSNLGISEKASMAKNMMSMIPITDDDAAKELAELGETEYAMMLDTIIENADDQTLLRIYKSYVSQGTYDQNIKTFGVVSYDAPSSISIYADTFEDKDKIAECIKKYNKSVPEEDKITYTDYVALIMSSVTTIINVISYVLIAFVSVSLVVSSIMIGIITYISVLERTKEIGILRAMGASKKNISQVFNAETFIIGLFSGIIGVSLTVLLTIPANVIIHHLAGTNNVNATLPIGAAIILIILSIILTLIGGIIPSKKAAKKDPVLALRTE